MHRIIAVSLCLAAAACSGGGGEEKKAEEAQAATIEAGQWETSFEVTAHRVVDGTPDPALKAAAGDKETGAACVTEADKAKPAPELFAGPGYTCQYKSDYIRNGRINASLSCTREGIEGEIMMSVQGSYTGTTFEGTVGTTTYLPGRGDFESSRKIAGRKVAPACAAEEPAAGAAGNKAG
jgi:hypothetical protein